MFSLNAPRRLTAPLGFMAMLVVLPFLGACQTTCVGDPRTDDLGCATMALSSGTYTRQTQTLRGQAEQQLAASAAALGRASSAQQQAATAASTRRSAEQQAGAQASEIAQLRRQLQASNARLTQARGLAQPDVAQIRRLEAEVSTLQSQINNLASQ